MELGIVMLEVHSYNKGYNFTSTRGRRHTAPELFLYLKGENMLKLMCNCPELQGAWIPKVGDWTDKGIITKTTVSNYAGTIVPEWVTVYRAGYDNLDRGKLIWLPTQKQIQAKLKAIWFGVTDHYVRTEFHRWYNESRLKYDTWELTGDEIWIAFYIHRVCNKVWKFKTKKKQWKEV